MKIVEARLAVLGNELAGFCGFGHGELGCDALRGREALCCGIVSVVAARRGFLDNHAMREVKHSALVAQAAESTVRPHQRYRELPAVPSLVHARRRLQSRSEREIVATVGVKRGPLHGEFTTRNDLEPDRRIPDAAW